MFAARSPMTFDERVLTQSTSQAACEFERSIDSLRNTTNRWSRDRSATARDCYATLPPERTEMLTVALGVGGWTGTAAPLAERSLKLSANARNCSWIGPKLSKMRTNRVILEWTSQRGFRKLTGYRAMPALVAALRAHDTSSARPGVDETEKAA